MSDAVFKTKSGQSIFLLPLNALRKGSHVLADDGDTILEVAAIPESHKADSVIDLRAGSATLSVTKDHRIPSVNINTGETFDVRAAELKQGDYVFVDGQRTKLTHVQEKTFSHEIDVMKITFKADLPVGVFSPPPTIASKGSKKKPVRRGQNKHAQKGIDDIESASLLDTALGIYED